MMRMGRHVEEGSFGDRMDHMVPQFGSDAPAEAAGSGEPAPDEVTGGKPLDHMNQFLFDASSRLAAISLAAAISKSSSDC